MNLKAIKWLPTSLLPPKNYMDRERAWWATVHGVTKWDTAEQLTHRHMRALHRQIRASAYLFVTITLEPLTVMLAI